MKNTATIITVIFRVRILARVRKPMEERRIFSEINLSVCKLSFRIETENKLERTMFALVGSSTYLQQNARISVYYQDKRKPIHHHHSEERIRYFMSVCWKSVKCHALRIPSDIWVDFYVKYYHLKIIYNTCRREQLISAPNSVVAVLYEMGHIKH